MTSSTGAEKRRVPRLTLSQEQFRLDPAGKLFAVVDLSESGIALRVVDREDLFSLSVGAEIAGTLNLRREKYAVRAKVRHVGKDLVGCEFHDLPEATARALARVLDPRVLGADLKPIPTGDLNLWYHGSSGTEFLIEREVDGAIRQMTVVVLGNWIQWKTAQGLSTGVVSNSYEESEIRGVTRFETMLVQEDARLDHGKIAIAKALLLACNLPEETKRFCLRRLEGAQTPSMS